MTPGQKCAHCGKVTEFCEDFCTLCWCHRTKGKVLTDEQVATCRSQLAARNEKSHWQAEFATWQKRMMIPIILMILWCAYWGLSMVPLYLKYEEGLLLMVAGLLCTAGFAYGGFLAGGMKAVPLACSLLIVSSLICVFHVGDYLLEELNRLSPNGKGVLWSSIRLALCGIILVSCGAILRIKRPRH